MENTDNKRHNVGKKLENLLRLRKISKVEFAQMIGKSRNQVYSYLESEDVSSKLLRDWSEKLDVPIEYWFKDFNINIKGNSNTLNNIGSINSTVNTEKEATEKSETEGLKKEIGELKKEIKSLNELRKAEANEVKALKDLIENQKEMINFYKNK